MSKWKERMTMKNRCVNGNFYAEFKAQLTEEARLNALIAENLRKVKQV